MNSIKLITWDFILQTNFLNVSQSIKIFCAVGWTMQQTLVLKVPIKGSNYPCKWQPIKVKITIFNMN